MTPLLCSNSAFSAIHPSMPPPTYEHRIETVNGPNCTLLLFHNGEDGDRALQWIWGVSVAGLNGPDTSGCTPT